jgi:DNA (cytosine-5)-methyltransferase 1
MKVKVLELFGGIGACSKALEKLNIPYEIVDYVEIDKHAVDSFNAMHNSTYEPQDICSWNKDIEADIVMHGSPCQDFSLAGKQAGGDEGSGTRSSLMYETIRIVEKLKPKIVIWENVKNLVSKKHIHNFESYLNKMNEIGYKNYYKILNAKDYGIPQNRERVFTVSIRNDLNKTFKFPIKEELKLKLKDMLEDSVDESFYLSDDKIEKISHWNAYQKPFERVNGNNSVVQTITARGAGEDHSGMITYSDKLEDTTNLQEECLKIKSGAYARSYGSRGKIQNKDVCDTLTASMGTGGGNVPILKIRNATSKGYLEATEGDGIDISSRMQYHRGNVQKGTIQTIDCTGGEGHEVVTNDLRIRKLTPKECWRLMGFEDIDYERASKVNSKTQLYKQAGNSIVVNVLEKIIKELIEMEILK